MLEKIKQELQPKTLSLAEFFKQPLKPTQSPAEKVLKEKLSQLSKRDVKEVTQSLKEIKKGLEKELKGTIDLMFGGSVAKGTYASGISDVDMLVVLNQSELADKTPRQVLEYFAKRLKSAIPDCEVKIGNLAVTLKYKHRDIEIQLLPALETRNGLRISTENGYMWSDVIHPRKFAWRLTEVNQKNGNNVLPVIQLVKKINTTLPPLHQLHGYHIEALAIEAFKNYSGKKDYNEMLKHFFRTASKEVLNPMTDVTGQSEAIDSNLGKPNSFRRRKLNTILDRIASRMEEADSNYSEVEWRHIMGDKN